jgi:pyruvate formate lyase activating enzyme
MRDKPKTPAKTLKDARNIALSLGIKYCYVGNIYDTPGQTTYCPGCKTELIQRDWHSVNFNIMNKNKCSSCGTTIPGVFN